MNYRKDKFEYLESVNMKILVNDSFKITSDSIYLSSYVNEIIKNIKIEKLKLLETGAGNGIISILISKNDNIRNITAVEKQEEIYEYLYRNVSENTLSDKILPINDDIMNISGEYDYIFSNPPYCKLDSGNLPKDEIELISKYEKTLTLESLIFKSKQLLKNGGEFIIIIPSNRLNDLQKYIYNAKLNIIALKFFISNKKELVVVHGKKGGKVNSGIKIEVEHI